MLVENTTFDNTVVNFIFNVTKFGMPIDIITSDGSHELVGMETILAGNYGFLSYQNVCIYKMACRSINTTARALNHTSI